MSASNSSASNTTNLICHSANHAPIKSCCTGSGSFYQELTETYHGNATYDYAYCLVPPQSKTGSNFADCVMKAYNVGDRSALVPGNANISCVGVIPPVLSGAPATSAKWAAVALVAVLASTVVAL